jgi:transcription initiation factor TFIIB
MKIKTISTKCSICNIDTDPALNSNIASTIITDPESGEVICSNCGTVLYEHVDINYGHKLNSFSSEVNYIKSRSIPSSYIASGDMRLSTNIGKANQDANGHKLGSAVYLKMRRPRKWNIRTQFYDSTNKNHLLAFHKLNIIKDRLGLPDSVAEKAAFIYRKAQHRGLVKGRAIDEILTASVYAACRELGIPKVLREVAQAGSVRDKSISIAYRLISLELEISIPKIDPIQCIAKVSNIASLDERTKRNAISIMSKVTENELTAGKNPMSLAAAVIYISCLENGEKKSQGDIAKAAGVTSVTIRNRIREINKKLKLSI